MVLYCCQSIIGMIYSVPIGMHNPAARCYLSASLYVCSQISGNWGEAAHDLPTAVMSTSQSFICFAGIAYVILFSISVNFIRSVVSVQWQTRCAWVNSPSVKSIALQAEGFVMQIAALHDRYLSARDPILTLKVTLLLWGLVYLGYTLRSVMLSLIAAIWEKCATYKLHLIHLSGISQAHMASWVGCHCDSIINHHEMQFWQGWIHCLVTAELV